MKKLSFILLAMALIVGLAGCANGLHDGPSTLTIVIPAATSSFGSATTSVTITDANFANGETIDGSLFSWCGGSAVTLSGYGPAYTITATSSSTADGWIAAQAPATLSAYTGWAKLKINGVEAWIGFNTNQATTFSWANRQK